MGGLALSFILASAAARRFQGPISDTFYFVAASWVGTLLLLFSATVLYQMISWLAGEDTLVLHLVFLLGAIILSGYALYNGRRLTVREYTIHLDKLNQPCKVVHLSDIHVGTVHQTTFLKEVVSKTNALNPDLVLITGDLFDGSVKIEEPILAPLNDLIAPAYFSNGNHEEYEGLNHVRSTLSRLKLELLENQVVDYNGLQIVGVNDRQSLPKDVTLERVLKNLTLQNNKPTILMYHTPVEWETARAAGVDLMLSGHTHNGQIYPFTLLVKIFFKYTMGLYQEEGKYLHVSPGTGTWGPPMRLGSRNQITVINLLPVQV